MTAHTHSYPADELDCETCRAGLLEAFRAPADADYRPMNQPVLPDMEPGVRPHLFPGPEHTRTVDMGPLLDHDQVQFTVKPFEDGGSWWAWCPCGWRKMAPYPEGTSFADAQEIARRWADWHRADPLDATGPDHPAQSSITPHEDAPGGVWRAWCPCGWSRNGTYVRPAGALVAQRLAETWAARHRANPLEGTEE